MDNPPITPEHKKFDPFLDRSSRDVRNELSKSLILSIHACDIGPSASTARRLKALHTGQYLHDYINNRLKRYQKIIKQFEAGRAQRHDVYLLALRLWDQELFFEFHEWLEGVWMKASGAEKEVLQALIRAAGTYILFEHGRTGGAAKMAAKAVPVLIRHSSLLPPFLHVERLIEKLKSPDSMPPKLGVDQFPKLKTNLP